MTDGAEDRKAALAMLLKKRQSASPEDNGNGAAAKDNPENRPDDRLARRDDAAPAHADTAPLNARIAAHGQLMKQARQDMDRLPFFEPFNGLAKAHTEVNGRPILNFGSYNYLGLSGHPRVNAAAQNAIARFGTSVGASRIAGGERDIHQQLEDNLARFIGVDDAMVMISGYGTNESVIGTLVNGPQDLVLHDSLMHRSGLEGARLSQARRMAFRHNDMAHLEALLATHRNRHRDCLILAEGLYSMDGDTPDLAQLIEIKERYNALLMIDEAHSIGVLGKSGRGIAEHAGVDPTKIDLFMGTLSKSFAASGGYIAGNAALIDYLRYSVPGFVFSVGLAPAQTAASLEALNILQQEPERVQQLQKMAALFLSTANTAGLDTATSEGRAVVPIKTGTTNRTIQLTNALWDMGIFAQPVLYPAVGPNDGLLRFFITAEHTDADIDRVISAMVSLAGDHA